MVLEGTVFQVDDSASGNLFAEGPEGECVMNDGEESRELDGVIGSGSRDAEVVARMLQVQVYFQINIGEQSVGQFQG